MEGFFPDKFLDDAFSDESIENQNAFLWFTEIETRQKSFLVGSSSQNSIVEDQPPPPAAAKQGDFLQYGDRLRSGLGQESSQNVLNSNEGAFVQYSEEPEMGLGQENSCCINTKDHGHGASPAENPSASVQYRELPITERNNVAEYERDRGFRHMINERIRRQRQRKCCLALHSILPFGTKSDVNSVVQMAAKEIQKLEACRKELKRQNAELEEKLKGEQGNRVELKMAHPTSPMESMLETLQLLTELGMNTRSIQSNFSHEELFASLEIHVNDYNSSHGNSIEKYVDLFE